jgi:hypothetical protein
MSGFAFINFGGGIQHLEIFINNPPLMFTVPPVLFAIQIVFCRGVRRLRTHFKHQILIKRNLVEHVQSQGIIHGEDDEGIVHQEDGIRWCLDKWDEETYESENEISGLAISFLLLQAVRFCLTGNMPDSMGIEETNFMHPPWQIYSLAGVGMIFVAGEVLIVGLGSQFMEGEVVPGSIMAMVKRIVIVLENSATMGFAWALMYVSKWQITLMLPTLNPNNIVSRVLLALTVSVFAFFIILGLDQIADLECTGDKTDKAIRGVMYALSILVGFSWEQSFDGAVEVLAESCFKEHPIMAELSLTVVVFAVVYPQWRKYILRKLLQLKADAQRRARNERAAPGKADQASYHGLSAALDQ